MMEIRYTCHCLMMVSISSLRLGQPSSDKTFSTFQQDFNPGQNKFNPFDQNSQRSDINPFSYFSPEDLNFIIQPRKHLFFPELDFDFDSDISTTSLALNNKILHSLQDDENTFVNNPGNTDDNSNVAETDGRVASRGVQQQQGDDNHIEETGRRLPQETVLTEGDNHIAKTGRRLPSQRDQILEDNDGHLPEIGRQIPPHGIQILVDNSDIIPESVLLHGNQINKNDKDFSTDSARRIPRHRVLIQKYINSELPESKVNAPQRGFQTAQNTEPFLQNPDNTVPGHPETENLEHSKGDHNNLNHSYLDPNNLDLSRLDPNNLDHSNLNPDSLSHPKVNSNYLDNSYLDPDNIDHSNLDPNNLDHSYLNPNSLDHSHLNQNNLDPKMIDYSKLNAGNTDLSYLNVNNLDHSFQNPANSKVLQVGKYETDQLEKQNRDISKAKLSESGQAGKQADLVESHYEVNPNISEQDDTTSRNPRPLDSLDSFSNHNTSPSSQDSDPRSGCQTEFYFDFLNNWKERSGKTWMDHTGNVDAVNGKALFHGTPQSYLSIPFFTGNDLRPGYKLSLVIETGAAEGEPVTVVSNARFQTSTFGIFVVGQNIFVVVLPRSDAADTSPLVVTSLPLDVSGPNLVIVDHDDKTQDLWFQVNEKSKHVVARIPKISNEPLYIGAGASPFQPAAPFSGSINSLSFQKCPRNLNQR